MEPGDVTTFEAVAGDLLESLGYERATSPTRGVPVAARVARLKRSLRLTARSAMRSASKAGADGSSASRRARQMISEPSIERSEVTSWAVARRAQDDRDVRAFRERHVGAKLISLDEVAAWIDTRSKMDEATDTVVLEYVDAAGSGRRPVARGSPAGELRDLALELAARYGWTAEQASAFVLTGLAPRVPLVRSRVRHGPVFAASTRIVLDVDPGVGGLDVWRRYRRMRRALRASRFREPDAKALTLALFAMRQSEDGVRRWNEEHPQWRYADPREFERDSRLALRRLLEPPW
jgi:hypothetical protein